MQRTQIYFEQSTLSDIKSIAKSLNISTSEFIRSVMKKEITNKKNLNLKNFLDDLKPLDSFKDIEAQDYVKEIRSRSRIVER